MKKTALISCLLAIALLLCGCSADSVTEQSDITVTTVTEITAAEQTAAETEPSAVETEIAYEYDNTVLSDFTFLKEKGSESFLADINDVNPLYAGRDELLFDMYGIRLCENVCEDVVSVSENKYLSGDTDFDMLSLGLQSDGITLMLRGELQDLSEAGINITSASAFTYKELCETCAFGQRVYLLPFKGLSSAFSSACVLCCNTESGTSKALYDAYKSGTYTVEKVIELVCATEPFIGTTDSGMAASALLTASGFMLVQAGTSAPVVRSSDWSSKAAVFDSVSSISGMLGDDADFGSVSVRTVSEVPSSAYLVLPLPASENDRDDRTSSPVNPSCVTVIAAPAGLVYGRKTAAALDAVFRSSEKIIAAYTDIPGIASEEVATVISRSLTVDGSALFSWGDLQPLALTTLLSGGTLSSMMNTSNFSQRVKAFAASSDIYSSRLK